MRFNSDSPDIPDVLLERRDKGRVVFLCGAGISFSSGLPGFAELTKHVVDFYQPAEDSELYIAFQPWVDKEAREDTPKVPLDQVFHMLYQEYGREEVNELVANRLAEFKPDGGAGYEHGLIRQLSTSSDGKPQIVTTNFDLLLELGDGKDLPRHEPPAFPDIKLGASLEGITYLHGRLNNTGEGRHPYILSSADFGRAYLSEGWATSFILRLLESYTVVLVGYQAEDPQVKYLLQGLNHDGQYDRTKIYAFDKGEPEDIEVKWRDRGVTAIAYSDHPVLWTTLEAWAERAKDHRAWRSRVLGLAQKNPSELEPHERGMVAHLVRSNAGARAFANAAPPPHAEWLCVFDAGIRAGSAVTDYFNKSQFDPLDAYGLDSDPERIDNKKGLEGDDDDDSPVVMYEDLLTGSWGDGHSNALDCRLGSKQIGLPSRLASLSLWIKRIHDSPVVAWWAVKKLGLHPTLETDLKRLSQRKDIHPNCFKAWALIFDAVKQHAASYYYRPHYVLLDLLKTQGWTEEVLVFINDEMVPYLCYSPDTGINGAIPPRSEWDNIELHHLGNWEVKSPFRDLTKIDLPKEKNLLKLARILEGHLRLSERHHERIGSVMFYPPSCYPDVVSKENYQEFNLFRIVFDDLAKSSPDEARIMASGWRFDDGLQFLKLKLYALNLRALFSSSEVAEAICNLKRALFWSDKSRQELLYLIKGRWGELSTIEREGVIGKLLEGPEKSEYWSESEYPMYRADSVAEYLKWIDIQREVIPANLLDTYDTVVPALDQVTDARVKSLAEPRIMQFSSISQDESIDPIRGLPAHKIIAAIDAIEPRESGSFVNKVPFTGLVKQDPRKALAALLYLAKKGEYPIGYWNQILQDWPEIDDSITHRVLLRRVGLLPQYVMLEISHALSSWFDNFFVTMLKDNEEALWFVFDKFIDAIWQSEEDVAKSSIVDTTRGGRSLNLSRRTYGHAINSPAGKLTGCLFKQLHAMNLESGEGVPDFIKSRFDKLTSLGGEGQDHAIIIFSKFAEWMLWLDSDWTVNNVIPWFDFKHESSEPAWNGFISNSKVPNLPFLEHIREHLKILFPQIYNWSWGEGERKVAAQIIIELGMPHEDVPLCLEFQDFRNNIRNMKDTQRREAIHYLGVAGKRDGGVWDYRVIPFINNVWPREKKFRTKSEVQAWINFLIHSKEMLPNLLKITRWCLTPVRLDSYWMHELTYDYQDRVPLATAYPEEVLELCSLVTPNNSTGLPVHLEDVLDQIEQAKPGLVKDKRFQSLLDLVESA
ncbi:SIR2 family protein [Vibrio vulnificus]|uniref:SIR2 family protein n=1 Tax=Vibrio vulnificus TaxID=672 RepID=UPI001CDD65C1|nr:SIR2 family protein [Vibrio vulnificus]MCA3896415.1 SIR2 family protein [Vibrio vulnificus]